MPIISGYPANRVGMHVGGETERAIPDMETHRAERVSSVKASAGVGLVNIRQATDAEPAAINAARRPGFLTILFRKESHRRGEEVASVLPVEGTMAAITHAATMIVPAEVGKPLAATGKVEWDRTAASER